MANERIGERDLVLPALWVMSRHDGRVDTTTLKQELRRMLRPQGEDTEILANRSDDRFSQVVRNLVSHKTLEREGLASRDSSQRPSVFEISPQGRRLLAAREHFLTYVLTNGFAYGERTAALGRAAEEDTPVERTLEDFDEDVGEEEDEDEVVVEGTMTETQVKRRKRSQKLRREALSRLEADGPVTCRACDFDFAAVYGDHGRGYIELHHDKPVFMYEDQDVTQVLDDAIENLVPLCANCHRMVHRKRDAPLSIAALQSMIREARST